MKLDPHIQLRHALLDDHVKAGWVDSDMFLAYCITLSPFKTCTYRMHSMRSRYQQSIREARYLKRMRLSHG